MRTTMRTTMKTKTLTAQLLLAALFLVPSVPASAQTEQPQQPQQSDVWSPRQTAQPRPATQLTVPEGPVTSWDPFRFQVGLESRTSWLRDDGAKRLAGSHAPAMGGLSVQADVLRPNDQLAVRLDLSWVSSTSNNYQDGYGISERLESNVVSLGVSLRYNLLRWIGSYARLSGGIGWDKLTIGSGASSLHDRQFFSQGSAGAGLSLRSPGLRFSQSAWSPVVGVMGQIEGGFAVASGSDFNLQSSPAGQVPSAIPSTSVAIGHVGRSAPYLRACLGIAF